MLNQPSFFHKSAGRDLVFKAAVVSHWDGRRSVVHGHQSPKTSSQRQFWQKIKQVSYTRKEKSFGESEQNIFKHTMCPYRDYMRCFNGVLNTPNFSRHGWNLKTGLFKPFQAEGREEHFSQISNFFQFQLIIIVSL